MPLSGNAPTAGVRDLRDQPSCVQFLEQLGGFGLCRIKAADCTAFSGYAGAEFLEFPPAGAGVVHACKRVKGSPVGPKTDIYVTIEVRHAFAAGVFKHRAALAVCDPEALAACCAAVFT